MASFAIAPSQAPCTDLRTPPLFADSVHRLCKVFQVVESETLINTCVSTPEVIVVGCSTIYLTEPTCITTVLTISSTITEINGGYLPVRPNIHYGLFSYPRNRAVPNIYPESTQSSDISVASPSLVSRSLANPETNDPPPPPDFNEALATFFSDAGFNGLRYDGFSDPGRCIEVPEHFRGRAASVKLRTAARCNLFAGLQCQSEDTYEVDRDLDSLETFSSKLVSFYCISRSLPPPSETTPNTSPSLVSDLPSSPTAPGIDCLYPIVTFFRDDFNGLYYPPCGEPYICYPVKSWFMHKASSVKIGTAPGCYLYSELECRGESIRVIMDEHSLGNFDKKLVSFYCFESLLAPATESPPTALSSASSLTDGSVATVPPQGCPHPLATFFGGTFFRGLRYDSCDPPNSCHNVPPWFKDKASSMELGTSAGCYLYSRPNCAHNPDVTLDMNTAYFGQFSGKLQSFNCFPRHGTLAPPTPIEESTPSKPLAVLYSEEHFEGTKYDAYGEFGTCYNVDDCFKRKAESVKLGSALNCVVYQCEDCACANFFFSHDLQSLGRWNDLTQSYKCEDYTPTPAPINNPTCSTPLAVLYSSEQYAGEAYNICGEFSACYNMEESFRNKAESAMIGSASICGLFPCLDCSCNAYAFGKDQPSITDDYPSYPGGFNDQAQSYLCFNDKDASPSPSLDSIGAPAPAVASSSGCANPFAVLYSGQQYSGPRYDLCGESYKCYNIDQYFWYRANSATIGTPIICRLFICLDCNCKGVDFTENVPVLEELFGYIGQPRSWKCYP